MAEFAFDSYPLPFYFGHASLAEHTHRRPSSIPTNPYNQCTTPENLQMESMDPPYLMNGNPGYFIGHNYFDAPVLPPSAPTLYEEIPVFATGLLPTSTNPPTSLPPSTFLNPSQNSEYLTHSPVWPTNTHGMDYCPCDQYVPTQMPELGYEGSSPASEGLAYSRMAVSEPPLPKTEHEDNHVSLDQTTGLEDDAEVLDPCYAELLRQCLLEAPDYTMSLRDLYAWVAENSPKAKDPTSTGWKNSVRHNLSMNQGFEKVADKDPSSGQGGKNRSYWKLTDEAALRGIQSTTRYRKGDGKRKTQRNNRTGTPDDKRVKSGAKGGQATRRLAGRRAAAAARSTLGPSRQQANYRSEPYPTRPRSVATPTSSPPPVTSFSTPISSVYWPAVADIQDPVPYAAPNFCKLENDMQELYPVGSVNFAQQPSNWSQPTSPISPLTNETNWLVGELGEMGLGLSF